MAEDRGEHSHQIITAEEQRSLQKSACPAGGRGQEDDREYLRILEKAFIIFRLSFPSTYFWRSHQGQEIDYLEELNGELRGYEIEWRDKRMKIPSAFGTAYPGCAVTLVNRETVAEFVTD